MGVSDRIHDDMQGMRDSLFGKKGEPLGNCGRCGKTYPAKDLQIVNITPQESAYLCQKCAWKKRMKEKFSGGTIQ